MTRVAAEAVGPAVEIVVGVVTVGVVRVVGCGTVRSGGVSKERQEIIRERLSCRWTLGAALESWLGLRLIFTPAAAVTASAIVALPLLVKTAQPAFEGVPKEIEDVGRSLGLSAFAWHPPGPRHPSGALTHYGCALKADDDRLKGQRR